jgi:hypothetical protein
MIAHRLSYADALTAAIRRQGRIEIDGLRFERRADIEVPTDYDSTGRHTMIFELAGTGKQYRVMVEPVPETHGNRPKRPYEDPDLPETWGDVDTRYLGVR